MQTEKFGSVLLNGKMVDIDKASLLELKNLSEQLKRNEIETRNKLEKLLNK